MGHWIISEFCLPQVGCWLYDYQEWILLSYEYIWAWSLFGQYLGRFGQPHSNRARLTVSRRPNSSFQTYQNNLINRTFHLLEILTQYKRCSCLCVIPYMQNTYATFSSSSRWVTRLRTIMLTFCKQQLIKNKNSTMSQLYAGLQNNIIYIYK